MAALKTRTLSDFRTARQRLFEFHTNRAYETQQEGTQGWAAGRQSWANRTEGSPPSSQALHMSSVARSTRKLETTQADPAAGVRGQANSQQKQPSESGQGQHQAWPWATHMTNRPLALARGPTKPPCPRPPPAGCYHGAGARQGWGPLTGSQLPNKQP